MPFIIATFFSLGLGAGCLTAHFFKTSLYAPILGFYQTLLTQLPTVDIDSSTLFLLACKKQIKYFLLLWFFSFTNIWKYYYRIFLAYLGFQNGLLLSFCLLMSGLPGIAGFLCFILPQSLLYVPSYLISIYRGQLIYENLTKDSLCTKKSQLIIHQLPSFLVAVSLLLLGCLLEGYLNTPLLRMFFKI